MNTNYRVIKTEEELRKAVESLTAHQAIGLATETTELDPYTGRLRLIQLATPDGVVIVDLVLSRSPTTQSLTRNG